MSIIVLLFTSVNISIVQMKAGSLDSLRMVAVFVRTPILILLYLEGKHSFSIFSKQLYKPGSWV